MRQQGLLPAVVFGKETGSIPITLDQKSFEKVYEEAGESTLVDVEIAADGNGQRQALQLHKVLISEVDLDPISDQIVHANLHAVSLTEKATATIPIEITGESPIVKAGEGMLLILLDEVEVEALPQDLPPKITLDISGLIEIDQSLAVKDLPVDRSKVEIQQELQDLVVKVEHAEMAEEEEEEEKEVTVEGVEVTTEKKEKKGEEDAEGAEGTKEPETTETKKSAKRKS